MQVPRLSAIPSEFLSDIKPRPCHGQRRYPHPPRYFLVQLIEELTKLEWYYDAKVMAADSTVGKQDQSIHFGTKSPVRAADADAVSVVTDSSQDARMLTCWVPPSHFRRTHTTTRAVPLGRMGYCELQPVGHCNLPVHTMLCHRGHLSVCSLGVVGLLNPIGDYCRDHH